MRNVKLSEAIEMNMAHLIAKGMAPNTIKNGHHALNRAVRLWGDIYVCNIKPVHIDRLFASAAWAPNTRNMYLGVIRRFFAWARNEQMMARDYDPTFGWTNAKRVIAKRLRVPQEEFQDLLDATEHPRDRAYIALGLMLMLRSSEIVSLKIGDISFGDGTIAIYRHKTKQADEMPIDQVLREELVAWLNYYREEQGELRPDWYLIPAKESPSCDWDVEAGRLLPVEGQVTRLKPEHYLHAPYMIPQKALAKLGYETFREGGHTLRRSAARAMADNLRAQGADSALLDVAGWLGHSDVRVTQHYIGWDIQRERRNASVQDKPLFPVMLKKREKGLRIVRDIHSG